LEIRASRTETKPQENAHVKNSQDIFDVFIKLTFTSPLLKTKGILIDVIVLSSFSRDLTPF